MLTFLCRSKVLAVRHREQFGSVRTGDINLKMALPAMDEDQTDTVMIKRSNCTKTLQLREFAVVKL